MKKALLILIVVAVVGGGLYLNSQMKQYEIRIPPYQAPGELVLLDQGWDEAMRLRFHHTPQGTQLLPAAWLMALEQPCFNPFGCPLLTEPTYLARFGFLASKAESDINPAALPIGFAYQKDFTDPQTNKTYPVVGFTCAACHSGEIHYGKYTLRIEGGPARADITEVQKAIAYAVGFTQRIPGRYGRFEKRVLGDNATDAQKAELRASFDGFIKQALSEADAANKTQAYAVEGGPGRVDALTRIGNQVFAADMGNYANLAKADAPVRFPQVWDASWLNWVQYNASIADPLVRNIGEALGVRASLKAYGDDTKQLKNSVFMHGLRAIEDWLAGPAPFAGLRSPKWPAVFPPLDAARVQRGAALYKKLCQQCHLPPIDELMEDLKSKSPVYWESGYGDKKFLRVTVVETGHIGTDPLAAKGFAERTADTGALGLGRVSAAEGLKRITWGIAENFFAAAKITEEQQLAWRGYHKSDEMVRAPVAYRARPLNGVWAIGPYLHNGAVPNLYEMLSPPAERTKVFFTGSKKFDPVKVGFETTQFEGAFRFDVTTTGNSNAGHEFRDGDGPGKIGPALSAEDRWALVEYLKSI